jgi:hypothetical protein
MKKILLIPVLLVTFGVSLIASAVQAGSPAQNLLLVQMQLSPGTNGSSVPAPPRPKIAAAVLPGTQACSPPNPPRPNRTKSTGPAVGTYKC